MADHTSNKDRLKTVKSMFHELKILLIEDNPGDARLFQELFRDIEDIMFDIVWANSLTEGLTQLSRQAFDIIFSDLTLPDSQGLETLRKIKNRAPNIPVVIVSGYDDERRVSEAIGEGAVAYLAKGDLETGLLQRTINDIVA